MNAQKNTFTVTALCRQEHISRQAYYKGLKQAEKRRIELKTRKPNASTEFLKTSIYLIRRS